MRSLAPPYLRPRRLAATYTHYALRTCYLPLQRIRNYSFVHSFTVLNCFRSIYSLFRKTRLSFFFPPVNIVTRDCTQRTPRDVRIIYRAHFWILVVFLTALETGAPKVDAFTVTTRICSTLREYIAFTSIWHVCIMCVYRINEILRVNSFRSVRGLLVKCIRYSRFPGVSSMAFENFESDRPWIVWKILSRIENLAEDLKSILR